LHVDAAGRSSGRQITVRHLLSHTSGLDDTPDMPLRIMTEPRRAWTALEVVELDIAGSRARFPPGVFFHYSNTNYVLLGLIVEALTGQPLAQLYRDRLFVPLGMSDSYLHQHEPATPGTPLAHVYYESTLVPPWVNTGSHAAGGVVSTVQDLSIFVRALFQGRVFRNPVTLAQMRRWSEQSQGTHGLGLARDFLPGAELWGHEGLWSSFMYYWPERQAVICGTLNHSQAESWRLVTEVIRLVEEEYPQ
jgi:D-alanyl-D-alanine carboxypeptidase